MFLGKVIGRGVTVVQMTWLYRLLMTIRLLGKLPTFKLRITSSGEKLESESMEDICIDWGHQAVVNNHQGIFRESVTGR